MADHQAIVAKLDRVVDRLVGLPVKNIAVGEKPYVVLHALDRDGLVDLLVELRAALASAHPLAEQSK